MKNVFQSDEVRDVLEGSFFQPPGANAPGRKKKVKSGAKPDHYDVICISLYKEDLTRLDKLVRDLKAAGHRKMSRSGLIRYALDTVDLSKLPKAY